MAVLQYCTCRSIATNWAPDKPGTWDRYVNALLESGYAASSVWTMVFPNLRCILRYAMFATFVTGQPHQEFYGDYMRHSSCIQIEWHSTDTAA